MIDEGDLPLVSLYKWCAVNVNKKGRKIFYAAAWRGGKNVYMHRLILSAPNGVRVDHKDGNGLHNTRENLRIATHQQNLQNRVGPQSNNVSGVLGVCWDKARRRWRSYIQVEGKLVNLGRFDSIEEATVARIDAARKYYGEFSPQ